MEKLLYLNESRRNEILLAAIEHETLCVVTRREGQGWRTCKSRFVSGEPGGCILLRLPTETEEGDQPVPFVVGERLGVSFRRGHKKCMFATTVADSMALSLTTNEEDVLAVCWPEQVHELQRRVYYRAEPVGRKVHVRFWPGGVAARRDAGTDESGVRSGIMLDISAGGMRLISTDVTPDSFTAGQAIGVAFTPKPRGETLVLDAVYRHCQPESDGTWSVGLQFVGMETSQRGRATLSALANLVTDYQRAASRKPAPAPVARPSRSR